MLNSEGDSVDAIHHQWNGGLVNSEPVNVVVSMVGFVYECQWNNNRQALSVRFVSGILCRYICTKVIIHYFSQQQQQQVFQWRDRDIWYTLCCSLPTRYTVVVRSAVYTGET